MINKKSYDDFVSTFLPVYSFEILFFPSLYYTF